MRGSSAEAVSRLLPLEAEEEGYVNGTSRRHVDLGWARSYGSRADRLGLRRGAWYRVVEDRSQSWVVLEVNGIEVRIPRQYLQFRGELPLAWTVVQPTAGEKPKSPPRLVCPVCHMRYLLQDGLTQLSCIQCGKVYPVDWNDPG